MEVLKGKKEMDIFDKGVKYAHSYWENKIGKKIEELEQIKNTALTDRTVEMMNDKIQILKLILEEE